MISQETDGGVAVEDKTETVTRNVPMHKVIMHNDDKTTMDFVLGILVGLFNKNGQDATKIMMEIHTTGSGLCGIYSLEAAEFKVEKVHSMARAAKFPLTCSIEPA